MRLHNFLVDYRDSQIIGTCISDKSIFQQDIIDAEAVPVQVGSDLGRGRGRISIDKQQSRHDGQRLRNDLCNALASHDMHRPTKNEWYQDQNSHVCIA